MKRVYFGDAVIIIVLLLFITGMGLVLYVNPSVAGDEICVYYDNMLYGKYSLDDDKIISISDSGVILEIKDRCAYIKESDCINKFCMHTKIKKDKKSVGSIVCLPNRVVVEISEKGKGVDIIAG